MINLNFQNTEFVQYKSDFLLLNLTPTDQKNVFYLLLTPLSHCKKNNLYAQICNVHESMLKVKNIDLKINSAQNDPINYSNVQSIFKDTQLVID